MIGETARRVASCRAFKAGTNGSIRSARVRGCPSGADAFLSPNLLRLFIAFVSSSQAQKQSRTGVTVGGHTVVGQPLLRCCSDLGYWCDGVGSFNEPFLDEWPRHISFSSITSAVASSTDSGGSTPRVKDARRCMDKLPQNARHFLFQVLFESHVAGVGKVRMKWQEKVALPGSQRHFVSLGREPRTSV